MASGIIASIAGVGTVAYTPTVLTKFTIILSATVISSASVNGMNIYVPATSTVSFSMWGNIGTAITFIGTTNTFLIVTALETGY